MVVISENRNIPTSPHSLPLLSIRIFSLVIWMYILNNDIIYILCWMLVWKKFLVQKNVFFWYFWCYSLAMTYHCFSSYHFWLSSYYNFVEGTTLKLCLNCVTLVFLSCIVLERSLQKKKKKKINLSNVYKMSNTKQFLLCKWSSRPSKQQNISSEVLWASPVKIIKNFG